MDKFINNESSVISKAGGDIELNPIGKIAPNEIDNNEGGGAMLSPTEVTVPINASQLVPHQSREEIIGDEANIELANDTSEAFKPRKE